MKKNIIYFALISFSLFSCDEYLDIVPDQTQELDLLFDRQESAYTALVTCYSYLPKNDDLYSSYFTATDALTTPIAKETAGIRLMKGLQSSSNPLMSYWSGYERHGSLWRGIRSCNTLIENMDNVVDMTQEEKDAWKAEAQFLKAFYHFTLLKYYGPIPITDENLPISANDQQVSVRRNTIDECITYITETIDLAISNLPLRVLNNNDLGRVDQVIAKSLKSRVLLFAASPLFNGNSEFYSGFVNEDGEHFFNQIYDINKWELAMNASLDAINTAIEQGSALYEYTDTPPTFDTENYEYEIVQKQYDVRYSIVDRWNNELLWGHSNPVGTDWWQVQAGSLMKSPTSSSVEAAWQWVAPTLRSVEMYYTKNGLPIDEDLTFDYMNRYNLSNISASQNSYAQYAQSTATLHLNREPRFYANIGFDRGYNRTWGSKWNLKMRKGETHGRIANTSDYLITGYALKKIVHPDSEGDGYDKIVQYSWPMIRLAELYLNFAEAANEFNGPSQEVYNMLNTVRERAGIKTVEEAWSDGSIAATVNKHTTQDGLRDIIRHERLIEFAFEGHRYNDLRRWKLAENYLNSPVKGWSVDETTQDGFYTLRDVGNRSFNSPRDYLHPISINELTINTNLIQNPGW
jgi:hypothetical protein